MKRLVLLLISLCLMIPYAFSYDVSGVARDAETGEGLPGIQLYLLTESGMVKFLDTNSDGTFTFTNVENGSHELEFHYYEPVIINGVYYLRTVYDDPIVVDGANVEDIIFDIPPHHPEYHVSGTLYDASTNQPITGQTISLRLDFFSHSGFFFAWSEQDGTYSFNDLVPDWGYLFDAFDNAYYYGDQMELVIDTTTPQEILVDFYLEPKSGVTVSGQLYDVETNQPIEMANRTVRITAINSYWAETNENGEFTFVNVTPGYYANIKVTSEDTAYINCTGSSIYDFTVPEDGLSDVALYQLKFETVHEITADAGTFSPGETDTIRFSLVLDDLVYGEIWGVELHLPDNIEVLNSTPFYRYGDNNQIFERKEFCSTDTRLVWEGYHSVFGSGNHGNLQVLNDSVYADVIVHFGEEFQEQDAEIFYEVFYSYACIWQPFSFGNIMIENADLSVGFDENQQESFSIRSYPNPASNFANIQFELPHRAYGEISVFDITGKQVIPATADFFDAGKNNVTLDVSHLMEGVYFYTLSGGATPTTGRLVIAR